MKNEKLELLLNKVVEFNKPDEVYCKGFLYKDAYGRYYLKVVEGISGWLNYNDKYYLNDGDEQFIIVAEKPKLMRVSLKSWHYKLVKFVLGSNAPTPKTMQNGCPYFWLLVFSMFVSPFIVLFKGIVKALMVVPIGLDWLLRKTVDVWITRLDDAMAYDVYWANGEVKMPKTAKIYFKGSEDDFLEYFINEKYNLNKKVDAQAYSLKKAELSNKWEEWRKEIDARRVIESQKYYAKRLEESKKRTEEQVKIEARKKAWEARISPFKEAFASFFTSIGKAVNSFKLTTDWKVLIRRTKQVMGAIITLLVLLMTYAVINILALMLTVFIDFSIECWYIYAGILALAALVGIGYILFVVIGSWLQDIINKYNVGVKVWYIDALINYVWIPVKYGVTYAGYVLLYLLWIPLKFIFYTVLWNAVLVNIGKYSWKLLKMFGNGLANSTGVFGEYFGASYSDYCPGIEWADTDDEE